MEKLTQAIAGTLTGGALAAVSFGARDLLSILAGLASLIASIYAIRAARAAHRLHTAKLHRLHDETP